MPALADARGGRVRDAATPPLLEVRCPAREMAVRRALAQVLAALSQPCIAEERRRAVELVLAELLNNVVEHARASHRTGAIVIRGRRDSAALFFEISDDGAPMPGGALPAGAPPGIGEDTADLPEGGFGWCLIRSLAEDLRYCRSGGRNHVSFRLPLDRHGRGGGPNAPKTPH